MKKIKSYNINTSNTKNTKFLLLKIKKYIYLKNFISSYHSKSHVFVKSRKVFDYFYKNKKYFNFFVAFKNGKIIGLQGFIPFYQFDSQLSDSCFLAYLRVAKSSDIAIGLRLFNKIKKKNFKFLATIGINNRLLDYHRWLGFTVGKFSHHFFINRVIKKSKFSNLKNPRYISRKLEIEKLDIIKIKSLNRKIFKFNIPEKSTKYLINRYYKNKFYDYFIYLIKYKSLETILVFRKITIKNNNLLKIVDLIGNQKNISNIGEGINFLLKKYQSDYADLYSYGIEEKYLKLSGFINRYKTDLIIPEYFEPFINKNIDINFGYINKFNKKKVRLVKGDGDTDRPSII